MCLGQARRGSPHAPPLTLPTPRPSRTKTQRRRGRGLRPAGGAQGPDLRSPRRWVGLAGGVQPALPPSPACGAEAWRWASGPARPGEVRRAAARGRTGGPVRGGCARGRWANGGRGGGGRGGASATAGGGSRRRWRKRPRGVRGIVPRRLPHPGVPGAGTAFSAPFPRLQGGIAWASRSALRGARERVQLQKVSVLWAPSFLLPRSLSRRRVLLPSGSCSTCC